MVLVTPEQATRQMDKGTPQFYAAHYSSMINNQLTMHHTDHPWTIRLPCGMIKVFLNWIETCHADRGSGRWWPSSGQLKAHWVDRGTGWWLFSGQLKTHQVAGGDALWTVKDSPGRQGNWLLVEVFSGQLKNHQVDRGTGCYWCSVDN